MISITSRPSCLTRRTFLKGAGAAAVAAAAGPLILPSRLFGEPAPSNRITIACIGLGGMGSYHLNALKTMPECEVVALCDVNKQRAETACETVGLSADAATQDFREFLHREDIDAVNIATPDHWHTPMAIAFMKAGKAVYLQKPVSLNVAEGRELSDTASRLGAILQTGSQQRSSRNFRFACELVRNGYLGEVRRIEVGLEEPYYPVPGVEPVEPVPEYLDYDMWLGPAPWREYTSERVVHFRGSFDYSGGYYADWGAHHLDIVQWALDLDHSGPRFVEGRGVYQREGIFDVPMSYRVRYEYPGGVEVVASEEFENGILFEGTEGSLFVSRERFDANPRSLLKTTLSPRDIRLPVSENHLQNFFTCVRTGQTPIVPAETGHRSATVCHIGNIAMRLGTSLEWDPDAERFTNLDAANRLLSRSHRYPWSLT